MDKITMLCKQKLFITGCRNALNGMSDIYSYIQQQNPELKIYKIVLLDGNLDGCLRVKQLCCDFIIDRLGVAIPDIDTRYPEVHVRVKFFDDDFIATAFRGKLISDGSKVVSSKSEELSLLVLKELIDHLVLQESAFALHQVSTLLASFKKEVP